MGVAPRIPGGGGAFKKAFADLASAERVLLWTNPSPTASWTGGTAIDVSGQQYAAYYIFYKSYASAPNTDGSGWIAVRGAKNYAAAGYEGVNRDISISGTSITVGVPFGGTKSSNCVPYQVFGIKGTEIR